MLAALLLLGLLYALYRYRIRHINKQALLRSDYEIKLNELENSALRTQMNPHFIFNSLNTINSFISLNETAQAHKYIASFSRLIRFILDHSRQKKILLENELEVLKLYIEIEQSFSLHKSHGIEITLKRISLFNKLHGKKAEVEITDLAQGTKVEIPLAWEDSF